MMSLYGMMAKTAYMMDMMRKDAIDSTFWEWKKAVRAYYQAGCDNGETTRLYKQLEALGANMEFLVEVELDIRDAVCG